MMKGSYSSVRQVCCIECMVVAMQGYLAYEAPTPVGTPQDPRHRPTVGF